MLGCLHNHQLAQTGGCSLDLNVLLLGTDRELADTMWNKCGIWRTQRELVEAKAKLAILERPAKTIAPGEYRVFLAPAAMEEVLGLLGWGGFSLAAHRTATTPLIRLARGEVALSPLVTLAENTGTGLAPGFQSEGFVKPDSVTLIESGQYKDCLASPRTATEFGTRHNAADPAEMPLARTPAPRSVVEKPRDVEIPGADQPSVEVHLASAVGGRAVRRQRTDHA